MKRIIAFFLVTSIGFFSSSESFSQNSAIKEKNEFIQQTLVALSGDPKAQSNAAKSLVNKGVQSERIYNRIAELIQLYSENPSDKKLYNHIGWLVKGLAYSGDELYRPIIESLSQDGKGRVKKHAKKALKILDEQRELNPIINQENLYTGEQTWKAIREANIVSFSNEYKMIKDIGGRALKKHSYDPFIFNAMHQRILSDYQTESKDKRKIDAYAYWLKVMTHFPIKDYIDTMQQVSESAGDKKLRKYAKSYLKKSERWFSQLEHIASQVIFDKDKIGSVYVELPAPEKIKSGLLSSLKKLKLEDSVVENLKRIGVYDQTSANTLKIKVKNYKIRSSRSGVGLLIGTNVTLHFEQENITQRFSFETYGSQANQYRSAEPVLSRAYGKRLTTILSYLQAQTR